MKALHTSLITAGLLAALTTSAMAQSGMGAMGNMAGSEHRQGQHPRMEKMREHMAARHTQHLAELKDKLQLQAGQEAAWKAFADAMQAPTHTGANHHKVSVQTSNTPERVDQMLALQEQRTADLKKRGEATKALYASLDADQKKTLDSMSGRWMDGQRQSHRPHQH